MTCPTCGCYTHTPKRPSDEPSEEALGRALHRAGLTSYPYATAEVIRVKRELREGRYR